LGKKRRQEKGGLYMEKYSAYYHLTKPAATLRVTVTARGRPA
jgi:hypothetical protein